jgi:hypothetical protein
MSKPVARITMTAIHPVGTFCYRLFAQPELGTGSGIPCVGLNIQNVEERTRLEFSGLDPRVKVIRAALENARIFDGHLFDTSGRATARELRSAIGSLHAFKPELVVGTESSCANQARSFPSLPRTQR